MATIKAYSDLEQSKKLAEILPLESADMWYQSKDKQGDDYMPFPHINKVYANELPCWSLAALLSVLPNYQLQTQDDGIGILCSCNGNFNIITADNAVDACYEMILKLHELNLL